MMYFDKPAQWVKLGTKGAAAERVHRLTEPAAPARVELAASSKDSVRQGELVAESWAPEPCVKKDGVVSGPARLEGRKRRSHYDSARTFITQVEPGGGYALFEYENALWAVAADGRSGPGRIRGRKRDRVCALMRGSQQSAIGHRQSAKGNHPNSTSLARLTFDSRYDHPPRSG